MNRRHAKTVKLGASQAIILPADWIRGNEIQPGDSLEVSYNGMVKVSVPKKQEKDGRE
jgi:antitoxin component of MazEF toxin-antitoxin module